MSDQLVADWTAMWNGKVELAEQLVTPGFAFHVGANLGVPAQDRHFATPADLAEFITQFRTQYTELEYAVVLGPVSDGRLSAFRWEARGGYGGNIERATAPVGTPFREFGVDMLVLDGDRIAEGYTLVDRIGVLTQLGAL